MATYYTNESRSFANRRAPATPGVMVNKSVIVAMTTAMIDNSNDLVGLFWVPKNAVIVGLKIRVTDMDSGSALLFDVGDSGSQSRLMSAISGQAAAEFSTLTVNGYLYKYTADTLINLYCNTAAGTPVAGTVYATISYFVDENFSTTALTATTTA